MNKTPFMSIRDTATGTGFIQKFLKEGVRK